MAERNYKLRINACDSYQYTRVMVSFPDAVAPMFEKPYVSVKRMQDRLAFVPWDTKTEQGIVAVGKNIIHFSKKADAEKMADFFGQYNLVGKTDSGIVYVKLCDRKPFDREYKDRKRTPFAKCTDPEPETVPEITAIPSRETFINTNELLVGTLKKMIDEKVRKRTDIGRELDKMDEEIRKLREQYIKLSNEVDAFQKALTYAEGGEADA